MVLQMLDRRADRLARELAAGLAYGLGRRREFGPLLRGEQGLLPDRPCRRRSRLHD